MNKTNMHPLGYPLSVFMALAFESVILLFPASTVMLRPISCIGMYIM